MYAIVSPFSKTFDEFGLIYKVPDFLIKKIKVGQIVEISIKDKNDIGAVLNITDKMLGNYDSSKIKLIISIKNYDIFVKKYREELIPWLASNYITSIHNSLNLFFPRNLKDKIIKGKLPDIDVIESDFQYTYNNKVALSKEQKNAYNDIERSINKKILFYGLTGSGKTEIYIKLINDNLNNNKQTLFLIPEIILTNQLSNKIIKVFGNNVLIINSSVTDAVKTKHWININNGSAKIIIGTRSAIFYPYNDLGLIIIDEEHDNSYISDSAPRYKTIDVAEKITELNGNKLVLASGTPSINSMYKAINGGFHLVNLLKKFEE